MKTKALPLFFKLALSLFFFLSLTQLPAQVLFDNGPIFNSVGTGAGGANESVLYTTTFGMGTIGAGHQAVSFNRVADDFAVNSCNWQIDSIVFFAYQTGSTTTSTMTGVNFRIWSGIPDAIGSTIVFGDTTTNRMTRTTWSGVYRITETTTGATTRPIMRNVCAVSGLNLSTGTYYLDWSSTGSLASGPWAPPRTPVGLAITGNAYQRVGSVWNSLLDGGTGNPPQGLPFMIYGSVLDPVVDAGTDQSICTGSSANLGGSPTGSGGQGQLTYSWDNGGTLNNSAIANPTATPTATTTYILTVVDGSGCTVRDTVTISVGAIPSNFLIGDTTICNNTTITLDAGAGTSYAWSNGATTQTITVGAGAYSVAVDNGTGCLASDTVMIAFSQDVAIVGANDLCTGASDTLTATVANAGSFSWSTGNNTAALVISQPGTYTVTAIDAFGCSSVDVVTVGSLPSPSAAYGFLQSGNALSFDFSDQSTGNPTNWQWDFGDGNTSMQQNPSHTYAGSGTYDVTLIVSNACGSDTVTMPFLVIGIANARSNVSIQLSPNPAASEFVFSVQGLDLEDLQVELVDLQGKVCQTWHYSQASSRIDEVVNVQSLSSGVYFMRFRSNTVLETRKLMIQ